MLEVSWRRAACIWCALLAAPCEAVFFRLPSSDQWCFTVTPGVGHRIMGSYEAAGGTEGVLVTITDPSSKEVFQSKDSAGKFNQVARADGKHTICFRSQVSNEQTISFNTRIDEHGSADQSGSEHVTKEHTEKVHDLIQKLSVRCDEIVDQQGYAITRESVHRDLSESTNSRVCWWTGMEAFCLVCLAGFQVTYLKSFFEVRSIV
eukprot:gnl/MRDRNA2_/MRDRNA2_129688_c0_seq1.p1 gnl/MRDRNA2_/MRDRNA2_129688_c0~~gnl/MRDRNA2_/MRDRNA2_129688_c0_seq1.p1  ORF type:complete len:205 (+),score=29.47 gnl/MRDRNA2_/MRDRNA2_129688_c0_seq1:68-682(+)